MKVKRSPDFKPSALSNLQTLSNPQTTLKMHSYDTLSQAVNDLAARGFTENFTLEGNQLSSSKLNLRFNPDDFEIVETHRFEGESDPGDMSVAYAIESKDGVKGVMVNAFGTYASTLSGDMAKKLNQTG